MPSIVTKVGRCYITLPMKLKNEGNESIIFIVAIYRNQGRQMLFYPSDAIKDLRKLKYNIYLERRLYILPIQSKSRNYIEVLYIIFIQLSLFHWPYILWFFTSNSNCDQWRRCISTRKKMADIKEDVPSLVGETDRK